MCTGLYQASFRLRHECPYRDLSELFPDLTIREWYLSDCQLLEITIEDHPPADLVAAVEGLGAVLHRSRDDAGLLHESRADENLLREASAVAGGRA